jgi:murein DD-endopeptidase MepM/ murein hydrolase activator NlpD
VNSNGWLVVLVLLVLGGGGTWLFFRAEGTPPALELPDEVIVGRGGVELALDASDAGGLRRIRVAVVDAEGETLLHAEEVPGNLLSGGVRTTHHVSLPLDAAALGAPGEDAVVRVTALDWSLRGNETVVDLPLVVDVKAPRVDVSSGLTYVRQGGSGAVAYRVNELTTRDGVRVGELFFRGYPRPGGAMGDRVALFAVPSDTPRDVKIRVIAEDRAGNQGDARWPVVVKEHPMPDASVTLSPRFIRDVVPRFYQNGSPQPDDPAQAFDRVNRELRAENEVTVREALADSEATPSFEARLAQLANSQVTSRFGERRSYFLGGERVSEATHYGYDLASTAAAPITAAGGGRVVYADELGIYGSCVLIDHGLGLGTLYGHLSRLDVSVGDRVTQGQPLGLSGDTGLAGGDHLHFAVLVGAVYVDPIEWWDAEWVRTHVKVALAP